MCLLAHDGPPNMSELPGEAFHPTTPQVPSEAPGRFRPHEIRRVDANGESSKGPELSKNIRLPESEPSSPLITTNRGTRPENGGGQMLKRPATLDESQRCPETVQTVTPVSQPLPGCYPRDEDIEDIALFEAQR